MPDNFIDTFNSIIPSHIMKFILWHEDADLDAEYQDEEPPYEEEGEEEEAVHVHFSKNKNLVFNK